MGVVKTIGIDSFPKQGALVGKRVKVCFAYNADVNIGGVVVRDDSEEPFETLFQLDDGRIVRAVECQYQPQEQEGKPKSYRDGVDAALKVLARHCKAIEAEDAGGDESREEQLEAARHALSSAFEDIGCVPGLTP
jgi:hypothetical protein